MNILNRPFPTTILTSKVDDASGGFAGVAAVANKKILVWGLLLTAPAGHTLTFQSNTTALTGPLATTGLLLEPPQRASSAGGYPRFETAAGEAFNIVADSAVQVSGIVYYTTESE